MLEKINKVYKKGGLHRTEINPNMIKLKEPKINADDCIGGMWTGYDGVGDIHKFCVNLAKNVNLWELNLDMIQELTGITKHL